MTKPKSLESKSSAATELTLRQRAEQKLQDDDRLVQAFASMDAARALLHELQVHQIELEMQNEELRRTQLALEAARSRYADLYDQAPVGYLSVGDTGLIEEMNLTAANLLGLPRSNLIQQALSRFIVPDSQDVYYLFSKRLMGTGNRQICKLRMFFGDGGEFWARLEGVAWRDDERGQVEFRLSMSDITAQRQAAMAAQESEARHKLAIEAAQGGLWDWDLVKNKVYYSPEWARQIGCSKDELSNEWEETKRRLHPDDHDRVLAVIQQCLTNNRLDYALEYRLLHKNGSYRWIHSRAAMLRNGEGQLYRMIGLNIDITEHKEAAALNLRRMEMQESNRLSIACQTACAIAHELNQPLTAIACYSEAALLSLKERPLNPEKLALLMEGNASQAQRAGKAIRQLIASLQKEVSAKDPVSMNAVVQGALDIIRAEGDCGGFAISLDLASDLPQVMANQLQIERVLVNLLRNGLEAMREAGLIEGALHVSTRIMDGADSNMVQTTVCNSGKLLDENTLKRIFDPFYTTKVGGVGMGLAIGRALIEAHGGTLWAEQNQGLGLSIHFTLPFAQ